jgi:hypothetical protein
MSIQFHSPEELAAAMAEAFTPSDAITAIGVAANAFTIATSTTADTAIQAATSTTPFGFASANEANAVLTIIKNLHTRSLELEAVLVAQGLLTAS